MFKTILHVGAAARWFGPASGHEENRLPNVALSERPERSETGVWIGIFAIVMTFAALTSAMIVREGVAVDWQHFQLPKILYLDTVDSLLQQLDVGDGARQVEGR